MTPTVDLVILSRNDGPLHPELARGLRRQRGVQLVVHRVIGSARPDDQHRRDAIARARNEGKSRGASRWLMFLDDDVVMDPRCVVTLVNELRRRPAYGALAADYLGQRRQGEVARHVSMGATLFRREALDQVRFVSDRNTCECQACCDDLRQLHWGINYCAEALAHHLPKAEVSEGSATSQSESDAPLVTCLCVTQGRVPMLRRSIQCFLNQTYPNRELVIVHQSDDEATRQFLANLGERSVLRVEVPAVPRLSLGSLRNVARQSGTGKYVATWDDDDWHSPSRLEEQMKFIQESGKRGCLLARYTLYDGLTKRAYVSGVRPWESSMVVERAILPPYPDIPMGEDTAVVKKLLRQEQLAFLDRPELFIYIHHGANTCGRGHWEQHLIASRSLGGDASRLLATHLDSPSHSATQFQTAIEHSICKSISARSPSTPADQGVPDKSMITCMCVTRGRVDMLRRAIACFLRQTYHPRELVVVYDADDDGTRNYLAGIREASIRPIEAPATPRLRLGALRNMAVNAAAGKYIAQWDDDDWHSPSRLTEQLKAMQQSGKRGCVLQRWTMYDGATKRAYVSHARAWEGSFVGERAIVPPYPDVAKQEDTPVVSELMRQGQLMLLDRPELYVYTHHGKNTWDREHWAKLLSASQPLEAETSRLLAAQLDGPSHGATQFQTAIEYSICKSIPASSTRKRAAFQFR